MSAEFLPFALPDIGQAEIDAVVETMRSGWLTTGPRVVEFEKEFAEALGGGVHAVAVSSATAGLHLALEAVGVGPGDEVIVPTWTFTATAEVVRYLGAHPVIVDVDSRTLNIDLEAAAMAVTPRTRAVIPVHFAGLAVDRTLLSDFALAHGLAVVEDAAHSFPVISSGRPIGTGDSDAVVFSFYATKTITTGEGGMLVTPSEDVARRARVMRLHGISRDVFDRYRSNRPSWEYEVIAAGFKYNLTDTAAAIGRVQLQRAEQMRTAREHIADIYRERFAGLPVDLPEAAADGDTHAWHLFVVRVREDAPTTRDGVIAGLADRGIGCSVHFIPLHMHPVWREGCSLSGADFPVASIEFPRALSLPIFSSMTEGQVERVCAAVAEVLAG